MHNKSIAWIVYDGSGSCEALVQSRRVTQAFKLPSNVASASYLLAATLMMAQNSKGDLA
jgi:hypothetical protein